MRAPGHGMIEGDEHLGLGGMGVRSEEKHLEYSTVAEYTLTLAFHMRKPQQPGGQTYQPFFTEFRQCCASSV